MLITQAAAPFACGRLFRLLHFVIDFVSDMHLGVDIVGWGEVDIKLMEIYIVHDTVVGQLRN